MPSRPCLTCGALSAQSYCPAHTPKREKMNPRRGSGWAAGRWRAKVLAQTGGRCAVRRCPTPWDRVQAHHLHALADDGPGHGPGVPLCRTHHNMATAAERTRRSTR